MASTNNDDDKTRPLSRLEPGLAIAQYTVVEQIGAGGMGEVYLADDSRLRRQVALKFMPTHCCDDPDLRDRFHREARAAAALNHPGILTVHDIGELGDRPYIVMEYFEGQTLKTRLRKQRPSVDEVVRIAVQIADALECAHGAGIVHRDIKADNILIDRRDRVKIVDFGLARIEQEAGLTQPGTTLGTLSYMAPEQLAGKATDERVDLFSLGVVMYELVSGRLPFARENPGATIQAILNEEPEPLTGLGDDLPPGLEAIISRLMQKDPHLRYRSATDVTDDLRRLAQQHEIVVPGRRTGRNPRLLIGAATLLLVATVAAWLWPDGAEDPHRMKMLVVLPFENLGAEADEYFATGIADEISTHLTKLSGLGVISRASASQYRADGASYDRITRELGVDYVLEGSVRWDRSTLQNRVRITTTLQRVDDNVAVWAETYDRTLKDIFAVQTDIARKVSAAMNVHVLDPENRSIDVVLTESTEAFTFYMQGRDYFNEDDWAVAQNLFERAISLDSSFAAAWAMLSRTHSLLYWWYIDRGERRLEMAREAAETALRLAPDLAESHLAMGRYYYHGLLDYDRAIAEYEKALAAAPGNSEIIFALGSTKRRQGNWDEAVDFFRRAALLDPRSRSVNRNLAETYLYCREFDSAAAVAAHLADLAPDDPSARGLRARIAALGYGDTDAAMLTLGELFNDPPAELVDVVILLHLLAHDFGQAERVLLWARSGDYFRSDSAWYYLQMGEVNWSAGQTEPARAFYDSARILLEFAVTAYPDEASIHSLLGVAYAGLGKDSAALAHGTQATELVSIDEDALTGTFWRQNLALIYALLGRTESARQEIEYLLSIPSALTREYVRCHPILSSV